MEAEQMESESKETAKQILLVLLAQVREGSTVFLKGTGVDEDQHMRNLCKKSLKLAKIFEEEWKNENQTK